MRHYEITANSGCPRKIGAIIESLAKSSGLLQETEEITAGKKEGDIFPFFAIETSSWGVADAPPIMENGEFIALLSCRNTQQHCYVAYTLARKTRPGKVRRNLLRTALQEEVLARFGCKNDKLTNIVFGGDAPKWFAAESNHGKNNIGIIAPFQNRMKRVAALEWQSKAAGEKSIERLLCIVNKLTRYYTPNIPSIVTPVLVAQKTSGKLQSVFLEAVAHFNKETEGGICEPLRLVEFEVDEDGIHYTKRNLNG